MALYSDASVERVRDAVDIVELVGTRTDLRRQGTRWVGLCPFHDERTPSFSVSADKKLYHCFGCGASGDAITFVRETEALDFPEAVELLGERYGVELERRDEDPRAEQRRRRRERLLALNERAVKFYESYLWESREATRAREYLEGRGLSEEVLRAFRVGFAPSPWDRVTVGAQRDGFTAEELVAAGLAQRGRSGLYDRFRERIMFPLADGRGRVLGFGARALREEQKPKYLNTAEGELYHKGRQLFGIDRARAHAARRGRMLVVEGYTDVLALHQAGLEESVAIMGTALTQEQLAELARAAPLVLLALDADRSGQEAMLRAARGADDRGVELRVVQMPEGSDPAELVREGGAEAIQERLAGALTVVEFEVRRVLADADLDTPTGRDKALEEARPLIGATKERSAVRDELVRLVADRLDVPVAYVTTGGPAPQAGSGPSARPSPPPGVSPPDTERTFLTMCLGSGTAGLGYLERLSDAHLSTDLTRAARDHLRARFADPLQGLPQDNPALAALVTGIAMQVEEAEPAADAVLQMSFLQLDLRRIEREIRRAREAGDHGRQVELADAKQRVRSEMDAVMGQAA